MQRIIFLKNNFQNKSYKKHFHDTYSISLITDGVCSIHIEGAEYSLTKGTIRIINPYEMHEIACSSWEHINLVLSPQLLCYIVGYDVNDIRFQNVIYDEKLALDFFTLYAHPDAKGKKIKDILEYLVEKYASKVLKPDVLYTNRAKLKKAMQLIHQNISSDEINLDKIASSVKLSKYHLIREFKKTFGLTPYRYIQNIKINSAISLMHENNKLPLSQIALECGFFDQSHFIKTYKKFFGHNPSKVKKQQ